MDESPQVLLEFQGGDGVLIPLINEYQAIIEFDNGQLSYISYRSLRIEGVQVKSNPWSLSAAVKAAARTGVFAIEKRQAEELTEHLKHLKAPDPILSVFACYALNELGETRKIMQLRDALLDEAAATFFDISLLSRDLLRPRKVQAADVLGAPICAQGWAFVNALGGCQKNRLNTLREHLVPSRWTHFTPGGVDLVKTEMVASGAAVLKVNVGRDA